LEGEDAGALRIRARASKERTPITQRSRKRERYECPSPRSAGRGCPRREPWADEGEHTNRRSLCAVFKPELQLRGEHSQVVPYPAAALARESRLRACGSSKRLRR